MSWLLHIDAIRADGETETLAVSAGLLVPMVDGILHEEVAESILTLDTEVFDAWGVAAAKASKGDVTLIVDAALDRWKMLTFAGSAIRLYEGPMSESSGDKLTDYSLRFSGTIAAATHDENRLTLDLRDSGWRLDRPLAVPAFAGTGGVEGGADLKGKKKPLILGAPLAVDPTPFLIDPLHLIYMLSWRGIAAVTKVTDGGNRLETAGDHETIEALKAAAIPFGSYATSLAHGLLRLGGRVALKLAVWCRGDAYGGLQGPAGQPDQKNTRQPGPACCALRPGVA